MRQQKATPTSTWLALLEVSPVKKLSLLALILLVAVVFCTGCEGDADEAKQPNDAARDAVEPYDEGNPNFYDQVVDVPNPDDAVKI